MFSFELGRDGFGTGSYSEGGGVLSVECLVLSWSGMGLGWVRYRGGMGSFWGGGGYFCHLRVRFEAFSNGFEQFFAKIDGF